MAHRWRVLVVVSVTAFLVGLDMFIVNVAFPDIEPAGMRPVANPLEHPSSTGARDPRTGGGCRQGNARGIGSGVNARLNVTDGFPTPPDSRDRIFNNNAKRGTV